MDFEAECYTLARSYMTELHGLCTKGKSCSSTLCEHPNEQMSQLQLTTLWLSRELIDPGTKARDLCLLLKHSRS